MSFRFTNLTRANEIGANCYSLELSSGQRILLDAGLHPRAEGSQALPDLSKLRDGSADAIVLSHAHQDHLGALPVVMRRHPRAPVFMTTPTWQLGEIMLHNSVNVMTRRKDDGIGSDVLFTHREVDQATRRWRAIPLHQHFDLTGERLPPLDELPPGEVSLQFFDAGHIFGSVGTLIRQGTETIFYSGDVNFEDQTVMRAASFPEQPLDTLIIETTRGDTVTPPGYTREAEEHRFGAAINEVLAGGGCVFIPVFALGKTQELLSMFQEFYRRRRVPEVPIYIGGLSTKLTEVFDRLTPKNGRHPGQPLLDAHELFTLAGPEAAATKLRGRRIYALSSGMMTEQTISNRLARQILSGPENALFTVGYADPDSPAGKLLQTPAGADFQLSPDVPPQAVRCRRETFSFSGHASRESVVAFIKKVAPKNVILVHGDEPALAWFRETLARELPRTRTIIPEPGVTIEVG